MKATMIVTNSAGATMKRNEDIMRRQSKNQTDYGKHSTMMAIATAPKI